MHQNFIVVFSLDTILE